MSQGAQVLIDRIVLEAMVQSAVELSNELHRLPFPQNTASIKASCMADTLRSFLAEPDVAVVPLEAQPPVAAPGGEQSRQQIADELRAEAAHLPGAPHGLAKRLNGIADRVVALATAGPEQSPEAKEALSDLALIEQNCFDLGRNFIFAIARVRRFITSAPSLAAAAERTSAVAEEIKAKAARYDQINTPEIADFLQAVENEALHQRDRWASDHDAGKTDADWFWLVGFLAGKALMKPEKALHHIITTAAACLNWHAHKTGASTLMRPGIGPDVQSPKPAAPLGDGAESQAA